MGGQILRNLGIKKLRLLTNNPKKSSALVSYGFEVVEKVPIICETHADNIEYLLTKKQKMGHTLNV